MNTPISNKAEWVWLQRRTEVVQEFDKARQADELRMRTLVFPVADRAGMIADHIFDDITGLENIVINKSLYTDRFKVILHRLGWKVKEVDGEDQEEKKDFYDALLRGGTLQ